MNHDDIIGNDRITNPRISYSTCMNTCILAKCSGKTMFKTRGIRNILKRYIICEGGENGKAE